MSGILNPPRPYCTCPPPCGREIALTRKRVADAEACIASLRRLKPLTDEARARGHRFELAGARERYATQLALALREAYDAIAYRPNLLPARTGLGASRP